MEDEILYREFYIKTTADKLIEMSEDLNNDQRVQDFGKLPIGEDADLCKTDVKSLISWLRWMQGVARECFKPTDTASINRVRMMGLLADKLERKIKVYGKKKENGG